MHVEAASIEEYVPAPHKVQEVDPALDHVPTLHVKQTETVASRYRPAGQDVMHVPKELQKLPEEHPLGQ